MGPSTLALMLSNGQRPRNIFSPGPQNCSYFGAYDISTVYYTHTYVNMKLNNIYYSFVMLK